MQAQEDSISGRWHGPRRLGPTDMPRGGAAVTALPAFILRLGQASQGQGGGHLCVSVEQVHACVR